MTGELRTATPNGVPVPEHSCDFFGCDVCVDAERAAAGARLTVSAKAKKFAATKRTKSAVLSARPVATQTINHVAGDVPTVRCMYCEQPIERTGGQLYPWTHCNANQTACYRAQPISTSVSTAPPQDNGGARNQSAAPALRKPGESGVVHAAVPDAGTPRESASRVSSLQQPLGDFVPAPAHLSDVTVARGFILAGNAYFTVRSQKTGVRYTYRVSRADCSRCGKRDCQCGAHPTYFVALLTGPDNVGDYTYLGMIRENVFRLTRGSKMSDGSKPVLAFRWVWEALAANRYPAQVEIWHEGRCGRCGRALTVPESIERGIGPDCATKGGL